MYYKGKAAIRLNLVIITRMYNRQEGAQYNKLLNLPEFFSNPATQRQRHYEAVRAIVVEKLTVEEVSKKFGYKNSTVYALLRDTKTGKIELFPKVRKGPQGKRTPVDVQDKIIALRRQSLSTPDIQQQLAKEKIIISSRTAERILKDAGFRKLKRRTNKELGRTVKNKIIPDRAENLDFEELDTFSVDCPSVGVFFFIPYIIESGILDVVKECNLPESSIIGATQACLSMLLLKLIGGKRLSHIGAYDQEPGLGIFAGLNILPKPAYMCSYSCRYSETQLMDLQNKVISILKKNNPDFYESGFINLDFHSIPHYGDESEMEKVWCGSKGKTMKGANTVFACDGESNAILYTRADILRKEEAQEIKKFVDYWKGISGKVDETLVFDCKFTKYKILDTLENDSVKFITLRKRYVALIEETLALPKQAWKRIYVPIPKRKYKNVSVYESMVKLKDCKNTFRQIVVKDHGRSKPTFILTNDKNLSMDDILQVYAKRWRIENKLSEMIAFFNLNALSSSIMVRIHFDILWTMIADTLYHRLAQDLRRFEKHIAPSISKNFIDMPGKVIYDGEKFLIKIRKRAHTPILRDVKSLQIPFRVPWLDGKYMEILWTA